MGAGAIETRGLVKGYASGRPAVNGLDMYVPEGCVYGFLGRNGAGKTTTIKVLMGLHPRDGGEVRVLSSDPGERRAEMLASIGYVSERQQLYEYMRTREMVEFSGGFYPGHDAAHARELLEKFGIEPEKRVRELSRGMLAKLCLVLALAHRPRLLILDEPTSGLDAVVRREFLESIVEVIAQEGRTVFFSTHIIEEVERVADRIGVVREGKMVYEGELDRLKETTRRVRLSFEDAAPGELDLPGVVRARREGNELTLTVRDFDERAFEGRLAALAVRGRAVEPLTLEEIFVDLVQ
ncbi:MAG: ABC transporter ATP-binding protein [Candidatus Wallbacteria bacterium]|nr:ABC transporter ATP-binding protein [Candidatus Wallbacteria bacterium]